MVNWRKAGLVSSAVLVLFFLSMENLSVRWHLLQRQQQQQQNQQHNSHPKKSNNKQTSGDSSSWLGSATTFKGAFRINENEEEANLDNPQTDEEEKELLRNEDGWLSEGENSLIEKDEEEEDASEPRGGKKPQRIRVCTIALNPRQGSLFRTNLLGEYGSGKYRFVVKNNCKWEDRRVRLISYVKCCESLPKVTRHVNAAVTEFDVVIVTGDEYCYVEDGRSQYRQYWGSQLMGVARNVTVIEGYKPSKEMMDLEGIRYPLYIPLGPREEFLQVRINQEKDVLPPGKRTYVYNFLGSMTSWSRTVLKRVVARDLATPENQQKYPSFVHITDKWHIKVTKSNGYIEPEDYKKVLLNSVFTLCPTGHNPEAYRIYEALEAGSIPILAIDPWYERARCTDAFKPFKEAGAPFIYLNGGWKQLESFLEKRGTNATWVHERYLACRAWYKKWMNQVALRFEAVLEHRYQKRMARDMADVLRERDELLSEEEEKEAIQMEEREADKDDLANASPID